MSDDIERDEKSNIECLYDDMYAVMLRHEHENNLSPATFIGTLEVLKANYIRDYQDNY